jgi:hypothetical protein
MTKRKPAKFNRQDMQTTEKKAKIFLHRCPLSGVVGG